MPGRKKIRRFQNQISLKELRLINFIVNHRGFGFTNYIISSKIDDVSLDVFLSKVFDLTKDKYIHRAYYVSLFDALINNRHLTNDQYTKLYEAFKSYNTETASSQGYNFIKHKFATEEIVRSFSKCNNSYSRIYSLWWLNERHLLTTDDFKTFFNDEKETVRQEAKKIAKSNGVSCFLELLGIV